MKTCNECGTGFYPRKNNVKCRKCRDKEPRICAVITCQRVFIPSSRHIKCPACRAPEKVFCECGNNKQKNSIKCFKCNKKETKNRNIKRTGFRKGNFTYFLRQARVRSKIKTLSTDIDEKYLQEVWDNQKGLCAISSIVMEIRPCTYKTDQRNKPETGSLDRINSSIGYVKGNVQFICYSLNLAKNNFSSEEFQEFYNKLKE